jgi:hypothetical protein
MESNRNEVPTRSVTSAQSGSMRPTTLRTFVRRCSTSAVEGATVKALYLQGSGKRRNWSGQKRVCTVVTGGGGRLFGHLLGEPGATTFLLEGVVPYDKHAFLGYLKTQGRELPAGFCSAASAVALARAARDRAMALTRQIERWPDCAGVSATATIISHYPRRGGYRAHAACADAFDVASSYEHVMVKGARERPGEDAAVARLALRACAEVAGVPEAILAPLRSHGVVLEPVARTNAVGEVAEGTETVPEAVPVAPEAEATARVWVPGVDAPIVAPATLPDNAVIVPREEAEEAEADAEASAAQVALAAEALAALGWQGDGGDPTAPWSEPPAPILIEVWGASAPPVWSAASALTNWGCLELLGGTGMDGSARGAPRFAQLLRLYPRATFALSVEAAFRLVSDRDTVTAAAAGGARFVVAGGAVEAAKRAWELPPSCLAAFTWIGAEDNDVRNVRPTAGAGGGEALDFEGRVEGLTDGSASTEIGTGRYAGGWTDGRPHGVGTMEWDNGITYEGEWREGRFNGFGAKRYSRGGGYEGAWVDGKRHGAGTTLYKAGRWEGPFVDDKADGVGTMFYDGESEGRAFAFAAGKPLDGVEPKHRG